jgi:hypothetical protein
VESIYYVMSWACHRRCRHCYEDRFRPYHGAELDRVVAEAERNFPRIVDHFPDRMTYLDLERPTPDGTLVERIGKIIVSGGEALMDPVRERVTYPVLERLGARYRDRGGVRLVVQTTGDLVTERMVDDLLARDVYTISCAGFDEFHVGLETRVKQEALMDKLARLFESRGVRRAGAAAPRRDWQDEEGPLYSFFGATPDSWIGKLWPRGRAWSNDLSTASLSENFCNRWSGGLNFLQHRYSGSEVSVEPTGDVYPCCVKTRLPIGNLLETPLIEILDSLTGDPVYEAISMGHPERMGIQAGWTVDTFLDKSATTTPAGKPYRNLCVGCDRFHEEILAPRLAAARLRRQATARP